jgi:hypothetical protein
MSAYAPGPGDLPSPFGKYRVLPGSADEGSAPSTRPRTINSTTLSPLKIPHPA